MTVTPEGLVSKLAEVRKVGVVASESAVKQGATIIRAEALAALTAAGVHGFTLHGVGKKGARLSAVVKNSDAGNGTEAIIKATGPWALIERDTKAHEVGTQGQVLSWGNGIFATGPFMAGGSHGRHPWKTGTTHAKSEVVKLYDKEVGAAIRKAF